MISFEENFQPSIRPAFRSPGSVRTGGAAKISSLAFLGDSTTAEASLAPTHYSEPGINTAIEPAHANALSCMLGKEIPILHDAVAFPGTHYRSFGVSGSPSESIKDVQIPRVLASAWRPSHLVIKTGTNDVQNSVPEATTISNVTEAIDLARANGMEPILMTITPASVEGGKAAQVASLNNAYAVLAAQKKCLFYDARTGAESAPGTEWDGMLYDNLHDAAHNSFNYGAAGSDILGPRLAASVPDVWSTDPLLNPISWASTSEAQSYPPGGAVTSRAIVPRTDGLPGNWMRHTITTNASHVIGTGDAGISYAPVAPYTAEQIKIYHRRDNTYSNGGSPLVKVYTTPQGDKILEVRLETVSFAVQNTAAAVVAAINASPAALAVVAPTLTGTGASACAFGHSPVAWTVYRAATTAPTVGRWIRAIAEFTPPAGSFHLQLNIYRQTPLSPTVRQFRPIAHPNALPLPARRIVVWTPWVLVEAGQSGFSSQIGFGGAAGNYDVGRLAIQEHSP